MVKLAPVNDHERTDEAILQGEFNGVLGRREQQKQVPEYNIVSTAIAHVGTPSRFVVCSVHRRPVLGEAAARVCQCNTITSS